MTAKEFLMRYRTADEKVKMLTDQIERAESYAQGAGQGDGQPHGTGTSDKVGKAAAKAADLRTALEAWLEEQERIKLEIIAVLGAIDKRELFEVLQLRYIADRPADEWHNIACVLDRSIRQVQRLHGEALMIVEGLINEQIDNIQ